MCCVFPGQLRFWLFPNLSSSLGSSQDALCMLCPGSTSMHFLHSHPARGKVGCVAAGPSPGIWRGSAITRAALTETLGHSSSISVVGARG